MDKNIVLIGMSGAGKTSVGRALSYRLEMAFVDMDDFIEKRVNMSVSEIFEKYGEEYFRKLETQTAIFLSENYKNTIISTGGGVVLNPLNMDCLKKCGTVIYINRSVEKILSTLNPQKRPLLKSNPEKLYDMYNVRHPLYLKYADVCVLNNGDIEECVENIAQLKIN